MYKHYPSSQAVHLQHNKLQYISPTAFYRSPSIVYLNVSLNHFDSLQNLGINSIRNVEVLDVSGNRVRRLSTSDLHGLDWLVELKLDDNHICRVQGEPFDAMPRLRVLTMRNNRIGHIVESSFRSVRGNLGVFDLDGNPLRCSCEMLWLRAWYQETNSLTRFPGPRCHDGSMLRDLRMSHADCQEQLAALRSQQQANNNAIPLLTNDHGDSYGQLVASDYGPNECDQVPEVEAEIGGNGLSTSSGVPGVPGDGKYFNDRYIDYVNSNESSKEVETVPRNETTQLVPNLSNTLLNYNKHKLEQQYLQQNHSPGSKFTFFGMPLPNLNMGNLWNYGRDTKTRSVMGTRGTPRLQVYKPEEIDFYTFLNQHPGRESARAKILHTQPSAAPHDVQQPDAASSLDHIYRPPFRTTFAAPAEVERGGFRPILPGTGNFRPMESPAAAADDGVEESLAHANSDRVKIVSESFNVAADAERAQENPRRGEQATDRYDVVTEMSTEPQMKTTMFRRPFKTTTTSTTSEAPMPNASNEELSAPVSQSVRPTSTTEIYRSPTTTSTAAPATVPQLTTTSSSTSTATTTTSENAHQKPVDTYDPWTKLTHASSSLSALVAPGAQLSNYRPPPGRSTIVKVSTSTATPKAAEFHQTTPRTYFTQPPAFGADPFAPVASGLVTQAPAAAANATLANGAGRGKLASAQLNGATAGRKSNMKWYYENYNRTADDAGVANAIGRSAASGGLRLAGAVGFVCFLVRFFC